MCTLSPHQWDKIIRAHGMDETGRKWEEVEKTKLADYQTKGDSISIAKIEDAKFTIVAVEDSDYTDEKGQITPGVKITTQESFTFDGQKYNKLHTTRTAIVKRLKNPKLRTDLAASLGGLGPLKCKLVKPKVGTKPYFDLVEVQ